jgi:hypothetical protein
MQIKSPIPAVILLTIFTAALGDACVAAQRVVLMAGGATSQTDGIPAIAAKLKEPFGAAFDRAGNMYIVEMAQGQRILKVDPTGAIFLFAGTGETGYAGDGGPIRAAKFNGIHNLAIAPSGDIYLADTWNCRVRKIDAKSGTIQSIAGTGEKSFGGDGGPATQAKVAGIYCVALDANAENIYLADLHNLRVRAVDLRSGIIRTVAGNGSKGIPMDGALAASSPLVDPRAVAVDSRGNLYILERSGNALRVVDPSGKIRTVVNARGIKGATGDGGAALEATMNGPKYICLDLDDNVVIADAENNVIRKYLPREGKIIRIAGTGRSGSGGVGGPPERVELNRPHGVFVHSDRTLYITDSYNDRILKIVAE